MAYLGVQPFGQTVRTVTTVTATASQTTFTPTGGYTVGYIDVFYNGVRLVDGTDFTATDGLTVVLTTGATLNAIVEMVSYGTVSMTDAVRRSGDTFSGAVTINSTLAAGNTTITGNTTTTTLNAGNTTTTTLNAGNTIVTGTANVAQGLTANTLTVSTNTATIGTAVYHIANGNMGIGVSSPVAKLTVMDGNLLLDKSADTGTTSVFFGDTTDNTVGAITYDHSSDYMYVATNGNERMRITSNGGISFGSTGTAYGSSGQVLTSNGNASPTWNTITSGIANLTCQVFTSTGTSTYTKPAGVKYLKIYCTGAGGGAGYGGAGGGGGTAILFIAAASVTSTVTVTIGTGGTSASPGNSGGSSSFGAYCSATGGSGGRYAGGAYPGDGGIGSGGTINLRGQGADGTVGGFGGDSFWGGGGHGPSTDGTYSHGGAGVHGGGGGASYLTGDYGGAGGNGIVVVEEFY